MAMNESMQAPRLAIEALGCRPGAEPGEWLACWRVGNAGQGAITLEEIWLPHGRFRWEPRKLEPGIELRPRADMRIEQPVRCGEAPGTLVENTFLILRVRSRGAAWRVLARHRVEWGEAGPRPVCELITAQRVGFSSALAATDC